jgi:hypothetical protein
MTECEAGNAIKYVRRVALLWEETEGGCYKEPLVRGSSFCSARLPELWSTGVGRLPSLKRREGGLERDVAAEANQAYGRGRMVDGIPSQVALVISVPQPGCLSLVWYDFSLFTEEKRARCNQKVRTARIEGEEGSKLMAMPDLGDGDLLCNSSRAEPGGAIVLVL